MNYEEMSDKRIKAIIKSIATKRVADVLAANGITKVTLDAILLDYGKSAATIKHEYARDFLISLSNKNVLSFKDMARITGFKVAKIYRFAYYYSEIQSINKSIWSAKS